MTPNPNTIGYCRACGTALDEGTVHRAQGTIFCADHVPSEAPAPPPMPGTASPYIAPSYTAPSYSAPAGGPPPIPGDRDARPGVAFLLGLIPGVGAIYNGQYAKGLVHVLILGLIFSILGTGSAGGFEPLFGILIPCLIFYMAFEAFHTAKKRRAGQSVDEFSGLAAGGNGSTRSRFPAGPIVLIALGVLFLLNNLEILQFRRILRYWPALLIVGGLYMLFERINAHRENQP